MAMPQGPLLPSLPISCKNRAMSWTAIPFFADHKRWRRKTSEQLVSIPSFFLYLFVCDFVFFSTYFFFYLNTSAGYGLNTSGRDSGVLTTWNSATITLRNRSTNFKKGLLSYLFLNYYFLLNELPNYFESWSNKKKWHGNPKPWSSHW